MKDIEPDRRDASFWLRRIAPLLILLAAIFYYGSYIGFWFNPHDEGGTAALTSMRLLAGETPIRDVELGYNVGWFWPVVALFKIAGVNFLVMRGYFFGLSTITALLGWALARRLTRNEWLALAAGLILVMLPGSQFKNYIPLVCMANTLSIVAAALAFGSGARAFFGRAAIGGVVLGLTLLVRIDIGYLFVLAWLGFVFVACLDHRLTFLQRFGRGIAGYAIVAAVAVIVHIPALIATQRGGYLENFTAQYSTWIRNLTGRASAVVATPKPAGQGAAAAQPEKRQVVDRSTLGRVSFASARSFQEPSRTALFALTYAPPLVYLLLLGWCAWRSIGMLKRRTFRLDEPAPLLLLALVGSMATFPQFFFFRPDRPHLSEFMPCYMVAALSSMLLLTGKWRWILGSFIAAQLGLYGWYALDHYSAGTIAARYKIKKSKRIRFEGANGVRVWVHKEKDYPELEGVRRAVTENSKPGEWLVCYPYQPGYNVMTDRPTYQHEIYQDNATTVGGWSKRTIAELEAKKPAVVIIDDRAINRNEASRFSVWAKEAYEHINQKFHLVATFDTVQVFATNTPNQ